MIGVSLPLGYLINGGEPYGERAVLYQKLREAGVASVELRAVRPGTPPEAVLQAAEGLQQAGLRLTVHGTVESAETAVQDLFAPLALLWPALRQRELTVVMHLPRGQREDWADMLAALAAYIGQQALPVRIAVENNRKMPDGSPGDSVGLVTDVVAALNDPRVGICFDMGHYYWAVGKKDAVLPPEAFLRRVIHTHIHALHGGMTHFPLGNYELPLAAYIAALAPHYAGCYHIELEYERFAALMAAEEALFESIAALQRALAQNDRVSL